MLLGDNSNVGSVEQEQYWAQNTSLRHTTEDVGYGRLLSGKVYCLCSITGKGCNPAENCAGNTKRRTMLLNTGVVPNINNKQFSLTRFSQTSVQFPDISLTAVKFSDISIQVVTLT